MADDLRRDGRLFEGMRNIPRLGDIPEQAARGGRAGRSNSSSGYALGPGPVELGVRARAVWAPPCVVAGECRSAVVPRRRSLVVVGAIAPGQRRSCTSSTPRSRSPTSRGRRSSTRGSSAFPPSGPRPTVAGSTRPEAAPRCMSIRHGPTPASRPRLWPPGTSTMSSGPSTSSSQTAVTFEHYEGVTTDEKGISPRAGGGRVAWFKDPDGNTFAVERG
jgi:hypothetical protein